MPTGILETIKVWHFEDNSDATTSKQSERSIETEREIMKLRAEAVIHFNPTFVRYVVLNFSQVSYAYTTSVSALSELKVGLNKFTDSQAQSELVSVKHIARSKFSKWRWLLAIVDADLFMTEDCVFVHDSSADALRIPSCPSSRSKEM